MKGLIDLEEHPLTLGAELYSKGDVSSVKDAFSFAKGIIDFDSKLEELIREHGKIINKHVKITTTCKNPNIIVYSKVKRVIMMRGTNGVDDVLYSSIGCSNNKFYVVKSDKNKKSDVYQLSAEIKDEIELIPLMVDKIEVVK